MTRSAGFRVAIKVYGGTGENVHGSLPHERTELTVCLVTDCPSENHIRPPHDVEIKSYKLIDMGKSELRKELRNVDIVTHELKYPKQLPKILRALKRSPLTPACFTPSSEIPKKLTAISTVLKDKRGVYTIPIGNSCMLSEHLIQNALKVLGVVKNLKDTREVGIVCASGYVLLGTALANGANTSDERNTCGLANTTRRIIGLLEKQKTHELRGEFRMLSREACTSILNVRSVAGNTLAEYIIRDLDICVVFAVFSYASYDIPPSVFDEILAHEHHARILRSLPPQPLAVVLQPIYTNPIHTYVLSSLVSEEVGIPSTALSVMISSLVHGRRKALPVEALRIIIECLRYCLPEKKKHTNYFVKARKGDSSCF
eukprot:TRINITY_DN10747_c0_g1_i1.p1 TRINITY_DN10747_c0_g1~~TRINITY_DN10747_c0_g1_i1.p1  ORF type:complete len:372 (+),score=20.95 TRINITY_DN10747_c0_g1_i1:250-1365(+)